MKCLAAGDRLLLHWASKSGGDEEVQALELAAADYTTDAASPPGCYKQLGELIAKLRCAQPLVFTPLPAVPLPTPAILFPSSCGALSCGPGLRFVGQHGREV